MRILTREAAMSIKKLVYVVGASCLILSPRVAEAKETLVELAKRLAPQPVLIEKQRELVPSAFEPMVSDADLIVHATVKPIRTYLSDDKFELFTDYAVTPLRTLYQRNVRSARVPGAAAPIVLTVWGGRTQIEGVEVELRDKDAPRLEDDSEVVLYLREQPNGFYRLVSDVTGALGVKAGKVTLLNNEHAYDTGFQGLSGLTIDQLDSEVGRRLKR